MRTGWIATSRPKEGSGHTDIDSADEEDSDPITTSSTRKRNKGVQRKELVQRKKKKTVQPQKTDSTEILLVGGDAGHLWDLPASTDYSDLTSILQAHSAGISTLLTKRILTQLRDDEATISQGNTAVHQSRTDSISAFKASSNLHSPIIPHVIEVPQTKYLKRRQDDEEHSQHDHKKQKRGHSNTNFIHDEDKHGVTLQTTLFSFRGLRHSTTLDSSSQGLPPSVRFVAFSRYRPSSWQ